MKKWFLPLALPIISVLLLILVYVISFAVAGDSTGYAGAVYASCGILFCCAILMPAICFVYSKRWLLNQKFRFFFTAYNSFLISLPYVVLFSLNDVIDFYFVWIIFGWCELWSLLGLVKFKRKEQKQDA